MNKGGRPRKVIDYKLLDNLCSILCTGEEIASILGVHFDSLDRILKRDKKIGFTDYYKNKSAQGKTSLRRAQFKIAIKGNPTMLIWMGKQYLGQKDNDHRDLGSEAPVPMKISFNVAVPKSDVRVTNARD
ncbi:MAG: hypothetical protein GY820_38170 [Gammaproteobacteria bacterium]|nr:hypothetical protein [Gammaproteobacteria bacterium]